jgi:hypothetical protein|tara:strand:+ start:79 stop:309 length:231 start_codon:yes stop_codon:yes gene_type:complete
MHLTKAQTAELAGLLTQARDLQTDLIDGWKGNHNPQVLECRHRAEGRHAAFTDVLLYLNNWKVSLRIAAAGRIDAR